MNYLKIASAMLKEKSKIYNRMAFGVQITKNKTIQETLLSVASAFDEIDEKIESEKLEEKLTESDIKKLTEEASEGLGDNGFDKDGERGIEVEQRKYGSLKKVPKKKKKR